MAFTDDSVRAKLSALNESQDSIVSVAQWIMFYRRHADRTAQLWLEKLKESNSSKKLNLIYLANEIMQQAKARKKDDFLHAFMPIIAEAAWTAYKGATQEVQQKIRRVVEVWRQRNILDGGIQDATEARIDEVDKNRSARSTGARLGGSLFSSSTVPPEFQALMQQHSALVKAETKARPEITKANTEFATQTDPATPVPSAPVQAGRLSTLMKSLASAELAVNESMKARNELIAGLEQLLESHRGRLSEEDTTSRDLATRRTGIEGKRKEVEDIIFRRGATPEQDGSGVNGNDDAAPEMESFTPPPPDAEQFTPPPMETLPEPGETGQDYLEVDTFAADPNQELQSSMSEPAPVFEAAPVVEAAPVFEAAPALAMEYTPSQHENGASAAADLLRSLAMPQSRPAPDSPINGTSLDPRKRRKMSHRAADMDEQIFGAGSGVGLDDDVAAHLGAQ